MKKVCGVYKIVVEKPGFDPKIYVGHSADLSRRRGEHFRALRNGNHPNTPLQRCFNKYGEQKLRFETVLICLPIHASMFEQLVVDATESVSLLNVRTECVDSRLGVREGVDVRTKKSKSHSGVKLSAEHRAAIGNGLKGRIVTADTRAKMSKSLSGRVLSPEHRDKVVAAARGRKMSDEAKNKIAAAKTAYWSKRRRESIGAPV